MNRELVTYFIRTCKKCNERKTISQVLNGADLSTGVQYSYLKCDTNWCMAQGDQAIGTAKAIELWNRKNGGHYGWWKFLAGMFVWRKAILFTVLASAVIVWASMVTGKVLAHGGDDFDNVVMSGKISVVKIVSTWEHAHLVYEVPAWVEMDSVARGIIEKDMFIIVLPDSSIEFVSREDNIHVQADVELKIK